MVGGAKIFVISPTPIQGALGGHPHTDIYIYIAPYILFIIQYYILSFLISFILSLNVSSLNFSQYSPTIVFLNITQCLN